MLHTSCHVLLSYSFSRARLLGRRCSLCLFLGVVSCCLCVSVSLCPVSLNAWAHPGLPVAVTATWEQQEPLPPFLLKVVSDLLGVYLAEYSYWSTLPLLLLNRNLGSGSLCQNLPAFQNQLPSALNLELSLSCIPSWIRRLSLSLGGVTSTAPLCIHH